MRRETFPDPDRSPTLAALHTVCEPLAAFDAEAQAWEQYLHSPLGRLRQELALHHVVEQLDTLPPGLSILDAGGGTGSHALPLAQMGHHVCLLDFSAGMLDTARTKINRRAPHLRERISLHHASIKELPDLFPCDHFDMIVCHTLLEYVPEPWEVLLVLVSRLRPGGLLSLLCTNPRADPLCWALAKGDLEKARLTLGEHPSSADLFGLPRCAFTSEEMAEAVAGAGVKVVADYGVRIFADYVPAEKLADPEFYARLLELELEAGSLSPYKLIARYTQMLGKRTKTL